MMLKKQEEMKKLVELEQLVRMNILTNNRLYKYDNIAKKYQEILDMVLYEKAKLESQM